MKIGDFIEPFINSRIGLTLVSFLARNTPPWLGYYFAARAAGWIASRGEARLVRAVRANQWVVRGDGVNGKDLDRAVRAVLWNSARSIYEVYHYMAKPEAVGEKIIIEPSFAAIAERPEYERRGLVVAGVHMNGFDLALQWLCLRGLRPLVLTIPNPEDGRRLEYEMRKRTGMQLVPGSPNGLRQAIRHLKLGGMVATGMDRPMAECKQPVRFFKRPAPLPTHHVYLALKSQTPVVVAASCRDAAGKYHLYASEPIEMEPNPQRAEALRENAERVLAVAETFIRQAPEQWVVPHPVWPEALGQMCG